MSKSVLWWGRYDADYSRNRILRQALAALGWQIRDFHPHLSALADVEAALRRLPRPDLVWVPCFRQRDLAAARRWCSRHGIPLLADPLISAWDKQVFEREKFTAGSRQGRALLQWESRLLQSADVMLADTSAHAAFFTEALGVPSAKTHVVYVGAEQPMFSCGAVAEKPATAPLDVLFFGSFIGLQGVEVIVAAAHRCSAPDIRWTLLGDGPERPRCEALAQGLPQVVFENWLPYAQLPQRICQADVVLGVFGASAKAGRVIPNKVFQALACGKPLITRTAPGVYPEQLLSPDSGIRWVEAGQPEQLAAAVAEFAAQRDLVRQKSIEARQSYERSFAPAQIERQLAAALTALGL